MEGGAVINDDDVQLDREKTQISNEYSRAGASYTMYSTSTGSKEPVMKLEPEDDEILEVKPSFLSQPSAHRTTHDSAWGETAPGDVVYVIEGSDETPSTLSSGEYVLRVEQKYEHSQKQDHTLLFGVPLRLKC